jgi:hypothetical protein
MTDDIMRWLYVRHYLRSSLPVFLPTLVIVGIIGNLLTVITIYSSPKLRRVSPHQYLAAVSISDIAFLIGLVAGKRCHSLFQCDYKFRLCNTYWSHICTQFT